MANNRLYLCCLACLDDPDLWRSATYLLAKYMPRSEYDWYSCEQDLDEFLTAHKYHTTDPEGFGGERYALIYENDVEGAWSHEGAIIAVRKHADRSSGSLSLRAALRSI